MPTKKVTENASPAARKQYKALVQKYAQTQGKFQQTNMERLKLLRQIIDRASKVEHARLHVETHTVGTKKSTSQHYKLTDPRAALLLYESFCNVFVPVPNLFCTAKFGCKPTFKRPQDWFGCVLIACLVNVCPTPGGVNVVCVYLCL